MGDSPNPVDNQGQDKYNTVLEDAAIDDETNATVVRPKLIKKSIKKNTDSIMDVDKEENNLMQVYKQMDFIVNNLSN